MLSLNCEYRDAWDEMFSRSDDALQFYLSFNGAAARNLRSSLCPH